MADKKNVYQMVTDRIIEQLEACVIPWEKPWTGVQSGAYNRVSKKPYSIINQMMLKHAGEYATFKQWKDAGGTIKKGAKSEIIVFWKIFQQEKTKDDGTKEIVNIPMLRYYNVFHISQVEGVEPLEKPFADVKPIEAADNIIYNYVSREGIWFEEIAGDNAFYLPISDRVVVPLRTQFMDTKEWYSTVFHELTHSTLKASRCDRENDVKGQRVAFGSTEYSKEELVAEIGSASLMNILEIENVKTVRNSAAYIKGWLSVLSNDTRFIVSAASKAEKAVNYILG